MKYYKLYAPDIKWYAVTLMYLLGTGLICAFLFYNSPLGIILCIPYLVYLYKKRRAGFVYSRKQKLREEFKNVLSALQGALRAGYSIENAFSYTLSEIKAKGMNKSFMEEELKLIINGLSCGKSLDRGLFELGEKSGIAEIKELANLIKISGVYGGNLIKLIEQCLKSMRGNIEVELEINTMTAAKRLEGKLMTVMPFVIMAYLRITRVSYINVLYATMFGRIFMTVCLAVTALMSVTIDRIIENTFVQV